jgi:amidohydrolase
VGHVRADGQLLIVGATPTADGIDLSQRLASRLDRLIAFRRDIHAHPEVGHAEHRTTERIAEALKTEGLSPRLLPGTGLVCDIGDDDGSGRLGLRADIDALPLQDESGAPYASTIPGVAHACGHDVHTTVVLGAGVLLAEAARRGELQQGVRLIFQPAEESTPGGALDVIRSGALDGVTRLLALHCDPATDVGRVGLRVGAITSASDHVLVRLQGPGGHTSRPHLTADLVFALGQVITGVPAALSRRLDPRAGVSLVWGRASAGAASNAIPRTGVVEGTLRCLRIEAWEEAAGLLQEVVHDVVAPYGVTAHVEHTPGVPPVVNDESTVVLLDLAGRFELGEDAVVPTEQSLGGEDFAWYLSHVPGALGRLGTRTPGGRTYDLHQGDFDVDERAIDVGVRLLARAALENGWGAVSSVAPAAAPRVTPENVRDGVRVARPVDT